MTAPDGGGSAGLAPLPTLPVFFKLRGRQVLIAGGGEAAVWKAEVLHAAGATVVVVADAICAGLRDLAAASAPGAIRLIERPWADTDLEGAALALGAMDDEAEAARFRDAAGRAHVPVNVIDKPAFCDFQFGTLVARGPLVLGITTDGAAPVFGQAIRARLEAWLPNGLGAWAEAAKAWRPRVQQREWDFRRRRRFWEAFAERALQAPDRPPGEADLAACLAASAGLPAARTGSVTLVGGGPGLAGSLTFAAVRELQKAEVLLFEAGLGEEVVGLARREAARARVVDDEAGLALAIVDARSGRRVAWLGTGNPATCARWGHRADRLIRSGVAVSRVAGLAECALCSGTCPGLTAQAPSAA